jgi:1-acyl-sn-glycerol-3-phosphate acyltransferase
MADRSASYTLPEIDMAVLRRSYKFIGPMSRHYFRHEARNMDRIPRGSSIIVTHHDGGVFPLNGICFGAAWYEHFNFDRGLYILTHDALHGTVPAFSKLMADSGLIPADRYAMDAALAKGHTVMVFPGAARESFRPYWQRRDIDLGGRTGFIAQAIRWQVPITPLVSAGAHNTVLVLARGSWLARTLRIHKLFRSADVLPLQLGLPWGLWFIPLLPPIPLPARIVSDVLPPVHLSELLGMTLEPHHADDPVIVRAGFDAVLEIMRKGVSALYDERPGLLG